MNVFKKQIVRWIGPDGRRCPAGAPDATRQVIESRKWYGTVAGAPVPLSRDKASAVKMLRQLVARADLDAVGLSDPYAEHRARSLADHLADFRLALLARGAVGGAGRA